MVPERRLRWCKVIIMTCHLMLIAFLMIGIIKGYWMSVLVSAACLLGSLIRSAILVTLYKAGEDAMKASSSGLWFIGACLLGLVLYAWLSSVAWALSLGL